MDGAMLVRRNNFDWRLYVLGLFCTLSIRKRRRFYGRRRRGRDHLYESWITDQPGRMNIRSVLASINEEPVFGQAETNEDWVR